MPADRGYLDYVMGQSTSFGDVSSRAMFGGCGIFHRGKMFALISGTQLYFKADDSNRDAYTRAGSAQFKPMPYYEVPVDAMEDPAAWEDRVRAAIAVGDAAPEKKRRRASR